MSLPISRGTSTALAALLTLLWASWLAPPAAVAQATYETVSPVGAPAGRKRRLLTAIPRLGVQAGTFAGDLEHTWDHGNLGFREETSARFSLVAGGDLLFRIGQRMRLGAGVYAMPRLQVHLEPEGSSTPERDLTLGTLIRVPFVIEWEVPMSKDFSLVAGAVPGLAFLVRGNAEKNRIDRLCQEVECEDDPALGPFIDGEFGALLWLDSVAVRADLRLGLEILSLFTGSDESDEYSETLSGLRMQLLVGVEL